MGFPRTVGRLISGGAFPVAAQLKPAPGIRWPSAGLQPTFVHRAASGIYPLCVGSGRPPVHRLGGWVSSTQGPSLRSGLFCPGPSSLIRPHPPHSHTHRDFTAWRLMRDAFAVREPRRPASGSGLSFPMSSRHAILYVGDRRDPVLRRRYCIRRDPNTSALCDGWDKVSPAPEGFYFEASRSSVTVAAVRPDYSTHGTPCACRTPAVHN